MPGRRRRGDGRRGDGPSAPANNLGASTRHTGSDHRIDALEGSISATESRHAAIFETLTLW